MYYHRTRNITIATALVLGLGALALVPADADKVAAAKAEVPSVTSAETVATIDAMLRPAPVETLPVDAAPAADPLPAREPVASYESAALTGVPETPEIDPSLRADSIGASAVNLRAGPSTNTSAITVLQPGQSVHVGEVQDGWAEVTLDDGTSGWVYSRYLASVAATLPEPETVTRQEEPAAAAPQPTAKAVVKAKGNLEGRTARIDARLAVHARPASNARTVFRTEPGERVRIVDVRGDWLRILTADGSEGWIQRG